jgi:hypothetical protein
VHTLARNAGAVCRCALAFGRRRDYDLRLFGRMLMEVNQLKRQLKDLAERMDGLRGFL